MDREGDGGGNQPSLGLSLSVSPSPSTDSIDQRVALARSLTLSNRPPLVGERALCFSMVLSLQAIIWWSGAGFASVRRFEWERKQYLIPTPL